MAYLLEADIQGMGAFSQLLSREFRWQISIAMEMVLGTLGIY
jgi:hypothetical protein